MKKKNWILFLLGLFVLVGCSPTKKPYSETDAVRGEYGNSDRAYGGSTPAYLEQNWDHETRMEWWYTSQGSRLVPYDWFLALEQSGSDRLIRSNENLEGLRFIPWPADPKWNPDGLPIGLVADIDKKTGRKHFGFTCAACHTGLIEYDGQFVLVEGGPAHSDFDRLIEDVGASLEATLKDQEKFSRFADRVVGKGAEATAVEALKTELAQKSTELNERIRINKPPHPAGYARLDAFGNIFNEASVFAIGEPSNAKLANAPVSYPVVWDTPQHDIVQWAGIAVNAGIGPYTRNIGEVVGVFGDLRIKKVSVGGSEKMRYEHHVDVKNLNRLEEILQTVWSPVWPEKVLPAVDQVKAQRGKIHYDRVCLGCHEMIDRTDPNRQIEAKMIPVDKVGTDPTTAMNIATSMAKTGLLEGQPTIPITKFMPNLGVIDPFGEQATTHKVVGNGVIGILREEIGLLRLVKNLPAYIKAARKNALYPNCDLKEKGAQCRRPPRYKARPLNGIWASAPFLHNGSVPNLWELLKKPEQRVKQFYVGSWELDPEDVGFVKDKRPTTSLYDTSLVNNSNQGHDYGTELSDNEKRDLIEYMKTL